MKLVRKQTYITPAQDKAVKLLAQRQGTTEAEILRQAIDQFLFSLSSTLPHVNIFRLYADFLQTQFICS